MPQHSRRTRSLWWYSVSFWYGDLGDCSIPVPRSGHKGIVMELAAYTISAVAIMVVLLLGQQILLFDTGILSLGTPAFFACGAYVSGVLAKQAGYPVTAS